jgi:heme-degrading monooxygenase HmoA
LIVAYSYVRIDDEAVGAEFENAMRSRSGLVESFPGFQRFEFRRDAGRRGHYVIVTWWDSRADLRGYLSSEAHRSTHSKLSERARAVIGPPRVEVHEVLTSATA